MDTIMIEAGKFVLWALVPGVSQVEFKPAPEDWFGGHYKLVWNFFGVVGFDVDLEYRAYTP